MILVSINIYRESVNVPGMRNSETESKRIEAQRSGEESTWAIWLPLPPPLQIGGYTVGSPLVGAQGGGLRMCVESGLPPGGL